MCGGIVSCSKKFKEIKEYGIVSFMRTKAWENLKLETE
jgi:hypothetical protein